MKYVFFDFDGVLIDTFIMSYEINKEADDNLSLKKFRSFYDINIHKFVEENKVKMKLPLDFFSRYQEKVRELKVPDELKKIVKELKKTYTLAIVSSTPSTIISKILEQDNVRDYFSDILGIDTHASKVVKIKMLLDKYKINPEDTVFITDTVGDVLEARECGVKSIAVTWGFQEEAVLKESNPDKVVSTPEELMSAIKLILND